jgi:hypothetical protein
MIKELRVDYRKCFTNCALSSTARRFSPTTLRSNLTVFARKIGAVAQKTLYETNPAPVSSAQFFFLAGLGNLPPHAPGLRFEDKRTVVPVPEQALSHARLELTAAFVSKGHDVRTPWAGSL